MGITEIGCRCVQRIQALQRLPIDVGHGKHAIEPAHHPAFEAPHPRPLLSVEALPEPGRLRFCMATPDLGLDVVSKQHGRRRQAARQIDRGHEEVADDAVIPRSRQRCAHGAAIGP